MADTFPLPDGAKWKQLAEDARAPLLLDWVIAAQTFLRESTSAVVKPQSDKIVESLMDVLTLKPPYCVRLRVGACFGSFFNLVGTTLLSRVMNFLGDIVKTKEDPAQINTRLAAVEILGILAAALQNMSHGTQLSPFVSDALQGLFKASRSPDPRVRFAAFTSLQSFTSSIGRFPNALYKEMYKCLKAGLADRVPPVRSRVALLTLAMVDHVNYIQTAELEGSLNTLLRSFENADYENRRIGAQCIGALMATTQLDDTWQGVKSVKRPSLDDVFAMMAAAFVRGSPGDILKGDLLKTAAAPREVRATVADAYVSLFARLGANWVEKNVPRVVSLVLQLVNSKTTSPADAPYTRAFAESIINRVLARMLGEQGRMDAVQELIKFVGTTMEAVAAESLSTADRDVASHSLACALTAIGDLAGTIGTPCASLLDAMTTPVFATLLHPAARVRAAAAECLRRTATAVPGKAAALAQLSFERVLRFRSSADGMLASSLCLAAIMAGSSKSSLGFPQSLYTNVGNAALEFIGNPSGPASVEAGWTLLAGLMSFSAAVELFFGKMSSVWLSVFPDDAETAKARDASNIAIALHNRCGALLCMRVLLGHGGAAVTAEMQRLICRCAVAALGLVTETSGAKTAGVDVLRMRFRAALFSTLRQYHSYFLLAYVEQLPLSLLEPYFPAVLPHIVAEFTLVDGTNLSVSSLIEECCHTADRVLFRAPVEDVDKTSLAGYLEGHMRAFSNDSTVLAIPGNLDDLLPVQIDVAVLDAALRLFWIVFPVLSSQKHRTQLADHFVSCIKTSRGPGRKVAVISNIVAAVCGALQGIAERRGTIGKDKVQRSVRDVLVSALGAPDTATRCAAAAGIGRLCQVSPGPFLAETIQAITQLQQAEKEITSKSACILALGSIHRHMTAMDSGRHLSSTVALLQSLCVDASPQIQTYAVHALTQVIDAASLEFGPHLRPSLSLCSSLILTANFLDGSVHQAAGEMLNSVVTTLGPEIQADDGTRRSILRLCDELQRHPDANVQLSGLLTMEQVFVFAPRHVNLSFFVPQLEQSLASPHLALRRTGVSTLRQVIQRQPDAIRIHGASTERSLLKMLDSEVDERLGVDLRDTILTLLTATASREPARWLQFLNDVLSGASDAPPQGIAPEPEVEEAPTKSTGRRTSEAGDDEDGGPPDTDLDESNAASLRPHASDRVVVPTQWQSKIFAVECVAKVISTCAEDTDATTKKCHFDLSAPRPPQRGFLADRLGDLVRTAFIAATSSIDGLRKVGLLALESIVSHFATSPDIEVEGHSVLEQFQAQVAAALRPAFASDTAPDVTAVAFRACGSWICSGVQRNLGDLKRTAQLLGSKMEILSSPPSPAFNESATTMLRLALLAAWADIFITSRGPVAHAAHLVAVYESYLPELSKYWLAAINDYATVTLPPEYAPQVEGTEVLYVKGTRVLVAPYYESAFPRLLLAAALQADLSDQGPANTVFLILGVCVRALCGRIDDDGAVNVLLALEQLAKSSARVTGDSPLVVELCDVLQNTLRCQGETAKAAVLRVVSQLISGPVAISGTAPVVPGSSPLFAAMEICASIALREYPQLNPEVTSQPLPLSDAAAKLVAESLQFLSRVPAICSDANKICVVPSILMLLISALGASNPVLAAAALKGVRDVASACGASEDKRAMADLLFGALEKFVAMLEAAFTPTVASACALLISCLPEVADDQKLDERLGNILKTAMTTPHTIVGGDKSGKPALSATAAQITALQAAKAIVRAHPAFFAVSLGTAAFDLIAGGAAGVDAAVATEAIKLLTDLVALAGDKALPLLQQIIPALLGCLGSPSPIHAVALAELTALGAARPAEFRAVIAAASDEQRARLAEAVRGAAQATAAQHVGPVKQVAPSAPTIQLKMDFSAFGKK